MTNTPPDWAGGRVLANRSLRHAIITAYACKPGYVWESARLAELLLVSRGMFESVVARLWQTVDYENVVGVDETRKEAYYAAMRLVDIRGALPLCPAGGWPALWDMFPALCQVVGHGVSGSIQTWHESDESEVYEWGSPRISRGMLFVERDGVLQVNEQLEVVRTAPVLYFLPVDPFRQMHVRTRWTVAPITPERSAAWVATGKTPRLRDLQHVHLDPSQDLRAWLRILAQSDFDLGVLTLGAVAPYDIVAIADALGGRIHNLDISTTLKDLPEVLAAPWERCVLGSLDVTVEVAGDTLGEDTPELACARERPAQKLKERKADPEAWFRACGRGDDDDGNDGEHGEHGECNGGEDAHDHHSGHDHHESGAGDKDDEDTTHDMGGHDQDDMDFVDVCNFGLTLRIVDAGAPDTWLSRLPPPKDLARALDALCAGSVDVYLEVQVDGRWLDARDETVREVGIAYERAVKQYATRT